MLHLVVRLVMPKLKMKLRLKSILVLFAIFRATWKHFQSSDFQAEWDDNSCSRPNRRGNLKELLSPGKMDIGTIQFDKNDAKPEFTAYVSTGGLMKPSDIHLLTQLTKISKFVTKLTNFLAVLQIQVMLLWNILWILLRIVMPLNLSWNLNVKKGILFKVLVKNYTSETNSKIHDAKKQRMKDSTNSVNNRKRHKLTLNSFIYNYFLHYICS